MILALGDVQVWSARTGRWYDEGAVAIFAIPRRHDRLSAPAPAPAAAPSADVEAPRALGPLAARGLRLALWAFACSTALGLFFASQIYVLGGKEITWRFALNLAMPRWYVWGLLTPGIIAADALLLRGLPLGARLAWHLPLGL